MDISPNSRPLPRGFGSRGFSGSLFEAVVAELEIFSLLRSQPFPAGIRDVLQSPRARAMPELGYC